MQDATHPPNQEHRISQHAPLCSSGRSNGLPKNTQPNRKRSHSSPNAFRVLEITDGSLRQARNRYPPGQSLYQSSNKREGVDHTNPPVAPSRAPAWTRKAREAPLGGGRRENIDARERAKVLNYTIVPRVSNVSEATNDQSSNEVMQSIKEESRGADYSERSHSDTTFSQSDPESAQDGISQKIPSFARRTFTAVKGLTRRNRTNEVGVNGSQISKHAGSVRNQSTDAERASGARSLKATTRYDSRSPSRAVSAVMNRAVQTTLKIDQKEAAGLDKKSTATAIYNGCENFGNIKTRSEAFSSLPHMINSLPAQDPIHNSNIPGISSRSRRRQKVHDSESVDKSWKTASSGSTTQSKQDSDWYGNQSHNRSPTTTFTEATRKHSHLVSSVQAKDFLTADNFAEANKNGQRKSLLRGLRDQNHTEQMTSKFAPLDRDRMHEDHRNEVEMAIKTAAASNLTIGTVLDRCGLGDGRRTVIEGARLRSEVAGWEREKSTYDEVASSASTVLNRERLGDGRRTVIEGARLRSEIEQAGSEEDDESVVRRRTTIG